MARRKPPNGRIVRVLWDDVHDDVTWQENDSPKPELSKCETVGTVTHWSRLGVVLVRTFCVDPDGTRKAGDRITIPYGCVTGWVLL